ncbi:hypothetical protein SAMN04489762_0784 [Terribacillus saccharophilus]|uniref:Uncharacterized protein n=1 Tax=Terribacillus saccharophilus TaxID=361277 RepID=A0AAX2ECD1_9BACI|nr:hypothetical protein SAMN04489762_0784 [Terribacillus saccharophilus]
MFKKLAKSDLFYYVLFGFTLFFLYFTLIMSV